MEEFFEESSRQNESIDIMRYVRGIVKRWWLVLAVMIVVIVPWILYLKKQVPVYEAEAWIAFENISGGGVPEGLNQSRITRLRSRTFAEEVTAELGLTMKLVRQDDKPIDRQSVFKTFFTNKNPVTGRYRLHFYPNGKGVLTYQDRLLDSLRTSQFVSDTVSFNGLSFSMIEGAARKYPDIEFDINWFPSVVESVISRLRIYPNGSGTLMRIVMSDTDPFMAAQTINRISEKFIEKSRDIRNYVNRFQREYFEEQLSMVQQELNRSDAQLKSFRNTHRMDLDQETQQAVGRMSDIDREINELGIQKKTLSDLLSKVDPQSPNFDIDAGISIRYIYQQIAEQPVFAQDADMTIVRQELTDRNTSLDRMLGGSYTQQHPAVQEISEKIQLLQDRVLAMTKEKIKALDRLVSERQREGEDLDKKLVKLPEEELRLIQLNRQRKANETLNELLLQQYKEAQIRESVASENISIIDPAMAPQRPITRSRRNQAVMGTLVALLLGLASAVSWEVLDRSIRTREDIKRFMDLPILGVIPKVKFNGYELQDSEKAKSISSQIVTHDYSPTPVGEAYRSLRTSLLFSKAIGPIKSLVIGSVAPGEGKSFTSANLAITMAQQKSKTLLIDADLRRGVLHNSFNCAKKPGLTNYLTGVVPLESILNETYIPNLSLITAGSMIPNPSELLGSPRMQKFIEGISQRYDLIIFDTPPLLAASDAVVLGTLVDGICMIVMAGKTKRNEVMRKMEMFQHVQAKVLGIVLNGAGIEVAHEGYSYYAY